MKKKKNKISDYILASRKGSRDAELENSTGFKSINKVQPSKKTYNRKKINNKNNMK